MVRFYAQLPLSTDSDFSDETSNAGTMDIFVIVDI
jgi:hypothetical protein